MPHQVKGLEVLGNQEIAKALENLASSALCYGAAAGTGDCTGRVGLLRDAWERLQVCAREYHRVIMLQFILGEIRRSSYKKTTRAP